MYLNLTLCNWWISVSGAEASSFIDSNGATVELTIGNNTGSDEEKQMVQHKACQVLWNATGPMLSFVLEVGLN